MATTFYPKKAARADENNYSRTLASTAWIITSNAEQETSTGTGVFVDADKRLVLTNAQVVGDSRSAVVFFPDKKDGQPKVKRKHYLENVLKLAKPGKIVAVESDSATAAADNQVEQPDTPRPTAARWSAETGLRREIR